MARKDADIKKYHAKKAEEAAEEDAAQKKIQAEKAWESFLTARAEMDLLEKIASVAED